MPHVSLSCYATNCLYTIYVKGFDTSLPEHEIKVQFEHFSPTADVKGLYFRKDKGEIRGAYINMIKDPHIFALNQSVMKGRKLTVESLRLRKAAKVEMKKNHVDPSMKPKSKRTVFVYNENDEFVEEKPFLVT